jgi:hypothetical protein
MFLGSYRFSGDPDVLLAAYARLRTDLPEEDIVLHLCLRRDDGITVLDACPSREELEAFAAGPELAAALAAVGLPTPDFRVLGEIHTAILRESVPDAAVGRP